MFDFDELKAITVRIARKVFLEDWTMKLIALVITLALWLGVSGLRATKTERLRNVALNVRVSNDVEITNAPVAEVDIVVTGDDRKIAQINRENLLVSLDLTDIAPGERSVQLTADNVNLDLPTGVRVVEIQPGRIAVKIEKVEEREVTVKVETSGEVPDGSEVYLQTVVPAKVRVRAPESYVKSLDFIATEKIPIAGRAADFTARQVALNVVNPKVRLIDTIVDVSFRIGEKRVERILTIPVESDSGAKSARILLYGPRSVIEALRADQIRAQVTRNAAGEAEVEVTLPPEIDDRIEIREKKLTKKP